MVSKQQIVQEVYDQYYLFIQARGQHSRGVAPATARADMVEIRELILTLLQCWLNDSPDVYDLLEMMNMDLEIPPAEDR